MHPARHYERAAVAGVEAVRHVTGQLQMLALVAALTGIVTERIAAERQQRRQALATLTGELLANRVVLNKRRSNLDGASAVRRRVYPRLVVSAAEGAIASGALADDPELLVRLHEWHNAVVDFNRRLDLTEMLTFLQGAPEAIRRFEQALSRDGGRVDRISRLLDTFLGFLDQDPHRAGQASTGRTPELGGGRRPSRLSGNPVESAPARPQPVPLRRSRLQPRNR